MVDPSNEHEVAAALAELDPEDSSDNARIALIAGLAATANRLAAVSQDMLAQARYSKTERLIVRFGLAAMLAMLVAIFVVMVMLMGTAKTNRENGQIIRSCTTPAGQCFQDNQARTAGIVNQLQHLAVDAAVCGRDPANRTDQQVDDCVTTRIVMRAGH